MLNYVLMLSQTLCLANVDLLCRIVSPSQRENFKENNQKDAVKDEVNKRLISSIIFRKVI